MNVVTRWNPFKEMEDLANRLTTVWGVSPLRRRDDEYLTEAKWAPAVDISEDDHEYLIQADLPELTRKDIHVKVENGVLYLSGERKMERDEKNKKYHRTERVYGSFVRSFSLPDDADPDKVAATFKDGVLTVRLTKLESAKPHLIDVKVA